MLSPQRPDADLIRDASSGDVGAMQSLLLRYRARLLAYADRRIPADLRRVIDPQDVLQDTWLEVFRRLRGFKEHDPASAFRWMATIARTRLINMVEKHRAIKRGGGRAMIELGSGSDADALPWLLEQLTVYERTPSQSAIAHEVAAALGRSIERLPADYRTAISLRYMKQVDIAAIAIELRRTPRATEMVCNRALKRLRRELDQESAFTGGGTPQDRKP